MNTEENIQQAIATIPGAFSLRHGLSTDEALSVIADAYSRLKIDGPDDKEGMNQIASAIKDCGKMARAVVCRKPGCRSAYHRAKRKYGNTERRNDESDRHPGNSDGTYRLVLVSKRLQPGLVHVPVYIADDGQEFSTEDECRRHEAICDLAIHLDQSGLYLGMDGCNSTEIAEWILDNYVIKRRVMKGEKT